MPDGFSLKKAIEELLKRAPDFAALPTWEQAARLGLSPYKWVNYRLGRRGASNLQVVLILAQGFKVDIPTVLRLGGVSQKYLERKPAKIAGRPVQDVVDMGIATVTTRRKSKVKII